MCLNVSFPSQYDLPVASNNTDICDFVTGHYEMCDTLLDGLQKLH